MRLPNNVLFCLLTITMTSFGQKCDPNWVPNGNKCYYFSNYEDTWVESLRACYRYSADLASTENDAENTFLESYVSSRHQGFWAGGTSMTHNGMWVWIKDNQPLVYDDWYPGEPNNYNNNEHCLEIHPTRKWNDESFLHKRFFICER